MLLERQLHHQILALFDDDPIARRIVIGLIRGERGEELRGTLDPVTYASTRKLISRRLRGYQQLWQ